MARLALGHELRVRGADLRVTTCGFRACGEPAEFTAVYIYESGKVQHPVCRRHGGRFAERHDLALPLLPTGRKLSPDSGSPLRTRS